jgi:hypothetical protein
MHKKNKFIFADISAIRNKGLKLLKYSEPWPVAEEEFQEFSEYLHGQYERLILELEDELFDIALIDYKFQSVLLQIFHYNYVKNYAKKNSIDILYERESKSYLNPCWNKLGKQYSLFRPYHNKSIRIIRRFIKNIFFNKHLPVYKILYGLFSKKTFISVGSNSNLKKDYILKKSIYCDHKDVYDILNFNTSKDKRRLTKIYHKKIMSGLISPYLEILRSNGGMFLEGISLFDIESCWSDRFNDIIPAYINILNSNSKESFLVTEASSLMSRILVIGYQRIGCKVFGFHHGGDFAATTTNQTHKGAMTHCQNLIVPTSGIAKQYHKIYSSLELETRTKTKYHSIESQSDLFFSFKRIPESNKKIKTVMLMGFPMSCQRRVGEKGLFFLSKISTEYEILVFLKKIGLNVLYKAHPDRREEVEGVFDKVADRVIYDTFEKSWEMADAFIFTYTSTTTFAYALETDRKIILVDVDTNKTDKELRKKLGEIVDYVPATIANDSIRVKFDKEKLSEVLSP